jgi:hypothetical protein
MMTIPADAPKTLHKILADSRVGDWSNEAAYGDGYWIYLNPGWNWDGVHCVHEWKVKDCVEQFKHISKCEPGCECGWDKINPRDYAAAETAPAKVMSLAQDAESEDGGRSALASQALAAAASGQEVKADCKLILPRIRAYGHIRNSNILRDANGNTVWTENSVREMVNLCPACFVADVRDGTVHRAEDALAYTWGEPGFDGIDCFECGKLL